MFEKDAKKWVKTKGTDAITCLKENIGWNDVCEQAFKDGAEFGYNKANEWHYVKDELPPENVPLDIITFDENKKRKVWIGEYKGGNGNYWTGYFNHYIDVPFAWKEIVLSKEIE